eukprot:TRINITY_DN79654_c0_g1_i1.p1 TRINITY_DN79654_c0_g1~~TRINITY_DN79654_c0_g1_i1.p1  ORF type:complete len:468 (+),score=87.59 TRINITY_DN79654_c0_g1_i1:11-1414(+)
MLLSFALPAFRHLQAPHLLKPSVGSRSSSPCSDSPRGRGLAVLALSAAVWRKSVRLSGLGQRRSCLARRAVTTVESFKVFGPQDDPIEIDISKKLGVGGQGTVYRCHRQKDPTQGYAVKAVPIYEDDAEGREEALGRECQSLLGAQGHPNIAACIGVWDVGAGVMHQFPTQGRTIAKYKMIVTEVIEGGELADFISQKGCLDEATARSVFKQVVGAVKFLHERNILHRDLKCENILVCSQELGLESQVKLVDFGVAKDVSESFAQTCVGTAEIMAPELVCADLMVGPGGDALPTIGPLSFKSPQLQSPGFGLRTQRTNGTGALVNGIEAGGQAEQKGVKDGWAIAKLNGTSVSQMLFVKDADKPKEPAITELLMGIEGDFSLEFIEVPKREFSKAIDSWSLGVVLYVMLVGKLPFSSQQEIAAGVYSSDLNVSEAASDLLCGLLQLDPAKRLSMAAVEAHAWLAKRD